MGEDRDRDVADAKLKRSQGSEAHEDSIAITSFIKGRLPRRVGAGGPPLRGEMERPGMIDRSQYKSSQDLKND